MWLRPGIVGSDEVAADVAEAIPVRLGSKLLRDAAKDYVLLSPFILNAVFPAISTDLLTESVRATGKPTENRVIVLDSIVTDFGVFAAAGLPGNLLAAIPQQEWPDVERFLLSVVFVSPHGGYVAVRLRPVTIMDPTDAGSRVVADIADCQVTVHAVVLDAGNESIVPCADDSRLPRKIVYKHIHTQYDAYTQTIVNNFVSGSSNPIDEAKDAIEDPRG
jgi:hypothetical protein